MNDQPGGTELDYFRAIENVFIRLRGAPLLLSPTDYQIASEWYAAGFPLQMIEQALEQLFQRRLERGSKNPVSSLRYCRRAVEAAWAQWQELQRTGARRKQAPLAIADRLQAVCDSLPDGLAERDAICREILAVEGQPEQVEQRLSEIDSRWLEAFREALSEGDRLRLEAGVDEAMRRLDSRLEASRGEEIRGRLLRRALRDHVGLPVLSLFSPGSSQPTTA